MSIAFAEKLPFAKALNSRPFALIWTGQTLSALGDGAFNTALAWQVLQLTGSATAMGAVMLAQTIPMLLMLLLGGVLADRLPRQLVMLWSDVSRAAAVLVIAFLGMAHLLQMWHLVLLALFFGAVRGFFSPAYQAIIPQLASKDSLASANSLNELSYQLYGTVGPIIGAACVALAGPAAAFTFDGLTFVASALCLMAARLPVQGQVRPFMAGELRREIGAVTGDIRTGLRFVAGNPVLWITMALAALSSVGGAGALMVALPKLTHDVYGQGVWLLGIIWAAGGVGSLLAIVLSERLNRLPRRGFVLYGLMIVSNSALMLFALPLHGAAPVVACLAMGLLTFGATAHQIMWMTVMQETVPEEALGRVNSIDQLSGYGMWPVGLAAAGIVADHFSPSLVFLGGGLVNVGLYGAALSSRDIRAMK